ncbi:alkane oxidation protein activator PraB [Pinirhizobacter soli]|uniref:alkane oxidation protein activator PraB n=1 Tax=Pinirhizobacter soli TaxID=2786953 RepID=UPI00202A4F04|nr:alkane oxidation protein activator PraB [Pinirhizobacter soli]
MNKKNVLRLAASLLVVASISAHAATISPAGVPFSATGTMVLRAGLAAPTCTVSMSGLVTADGSQAVVNSVSISGDGRCGGSRVKNLPWTIQPTSSSSAFISGVAIDVGLSRCGPSTVSAQWNNSTNTLSATGQPMGGNCTMQVLTLSPNPAFTFSDKFAGE